ncbi:glycerophosphodiester phosphodiesterase family protein [Hoyosella altamirensis]|uniref:Glycerophosphoryl diester phosphodiesterase n=1 Tax=Hoyosella altamirensis TaxID=616997 RepID=A0A839RJX4_9ACTN|nr:glycerophosphodiester phosphodiesterase family protein [Hoyosella altamirensis]MBB3036426.1 glycerophosphoryl diester phosphodiesterase [Hoyosella altamirensis]
MTSHPYLASPAPRAFAHRGWHFGEFQGLENTLAAFTEAARRGFEYLEIDVRVSSDGVVVVHHDATLDRVSNMEGRIGDMPWSALAEARVDGREPLSRLSDVLEALPDTKFNIDVKCDAAVEPFVDLVQRTAAFDRVAMAAFSTRRLNLMRRLFGASGGVVPIAAMTPAAVMTVWSSSRLGALGSQGALPKAILRRVAWGGMAQVPRTYAGRTLVDPKFIRAVHALGAEVHVWVVDSEAEMHELLSLGVDGLVTDRPETLQRVLNERNGS